MATAMVQGRAQERNMTTTYPSVTDRIVAMLENGTRPWSRPWTSESPISAPLARPLRVNGQAYTGANVLNLWAAASVRGFSSRYWMTFKAAKEMGAHVRKGARAELAFYVGQHGVQKEGEAEESERVISFLRAYHVFNADEIEGLPARYLGNAPVIPVPTAARMQYVDRFIDGTGAAISHGGDRAYYMPSMDAVRMPHFEQFRRPEGYYSVLLHELTHWTGHANRCARDLSGRFGNEAYAVEELVAELGAAFLCADLAISAEPREDHASYIASWIKVLRNDNRAIFRAAALAEKAAGFLHGCQPDRLAEAAD
jgi:antirestriction protein ArdC